MLLKAVGMLCLGSLLLSFLSLERDLYRTSNIMLSKGLTLICKVNLGISRKALLFNRIWRISRKILAIMTMIDLFQIVKKLCLGLFRILMLKINLLKTSRFNAFLVFKMNILHRREKNQKKRFKIRHNLLLK